MGTYNKGLLGGFSGTVGPVVGSSWKGIGYLKSKPHKTKTKKDVSLKVEIHRAKFKLATNFIKAIGSVLAITFPGKTGTTGRNDALAGVLPQAITGDYPDLRIDYSKVPMASGSLALASDPTATSAQTGVINFTWIDSSGYTNAKGTDRPILIAFCESLNACGFVVSDALRSAETASLPVKLFSGKQVHTWISFLGENGKDVSNSVYTGVVTVS
jgi:hypothetical protein